MLEKFKPTWMVKTIYQVSPTELKRAGIKAVLSDLDNTLIAWNNPNGTPQLRKWMEELEAAGIPLMVVSNNSYKRVEKAVAPLGLPFVSRALKPLGTGIRRACKQLNLTPDEVVMVGDQYLTDVLASHQAGVRCILVKPLISSDKWNTKFNRFLETFVKRSLKKKYPAMDWQEGLDD
ncbi:MAG TPA: YqeG family HAD IIIA-type phosphatase [Candidatus Limosilactobacillus faecipullorum]|nr:YqeG family HAD IIIA-type phosphatase [Candidatus Limosilactobacillus faecipullorum]